MIIIAELVYSGFNLFLISCGQLYIMKLIMSELVDKVNVILVILLLQT